MKINADFDLRVVVNSGSMDWLQSPMKGVERRPLDRVGEEVARATSVVRYAPGSHFSPHVHTGGEEFLVLEGVFQDEHGNFPAGSYIRNPPQSEHSPSSKAGCVILVKLWQFEPEDRTHVHVNTNDMQPLAYKNLEGVFVAPLYKDKTEEVSMIKLAPGAKLSIEAKHGLELFVVEGSITEGSDNLTKHSWLRTPVNTAFTAQAGAGGAKIWLKQGHLNRVTQEITRVEAAGAQAEYF